MSVEFSAFMTQDTHQQQTAAAVTQNSFKYMDTYSYSSSDDGCIDPRAKVEMLYSNKYIPVQLCNLQLGDILREGKIKWILHIYDLNHGNPFLIYNELTGSHPVQDPNENWIKAKRYPNANIQQIESVVYDIVMENLTASSIKVNGINTAVAVFPIPGMIHPYWGWEKVRENLCARYPDGGFVDIQAKNFKYTNGLVSSLF